MLTYFCVFVAVCCLSFYQSEGLNIKDGSEPFFRKDYAYVAQQEAWYKVHSEPRSWFDAYRSCKLEGGALLYPRDQPEDALLRQLANEHLLINTQVWVGAHSLFAKDIFVDLQDREISDYYAPWVSSKVYRSRRSLSSYSSGDDKYDSPSSSFYHMYPRQPLFPLPEPVMREEDFCVSHNWNDSTIDESRCFSPLPFVCKRNNQGSLVNTACQTTDIDYKLNGDGTKCYKIHKEPSTWGNAYVTCRAEQSYLVVINDAQEANFIAKSVKDSVDKMRGNVKKPEAAFVGFHDKFVEGDYVTIHGKSLDKLYNEWAEEIGSYDPYREYSDCGGIRLNDGLITELNCNTETLFVCEKDINVDVQPTTDAETRTETTTNENNFNPTDNIFFVPTV